MDETQRKQFRHLLGELGTRDELERRAERNRGIARHRDVQRFAEVKQQVLLPTLREFMLELEHSGHQTRLRVSPRERLRLEVQFHNTPPRRGSLEFALHSEPGTVRIDYSWDGRLVQEVVTLEQVDARLAAERVLRFLRGLL